MNRRAGFSMLELLVAMAVGLPVLLATMAFFRGQSEAYGRGEQHMEIAKETALLTRVLYTELKSIHAPMTLDDRLDLWVTGEADARALPNQVVVGQEGRELKYWHYPTDQPGQRRQKRLLYQGSSLLVADGQEARKVGRRVKDLRFSRVTGDPQSVRVRFVVETPSRPGIAPASGAVDLTVRLEGALNVVR
ncbi:MAG: prepilin-type N-terminal cleavage/methylation domain-containing protein [Candidatus Wallbacteria bacterium]|nr:prepilin-type N-terminal cleavage/methylation domain-containing protein [Candidatus Wallbacteria bacterium]